MICIQLTMHRGAYFHRRPQDLGRVGAGQTELFIKNIVTGARWI